MPRNRKQNRDNAKRRKEHIHKNVSNTVAPSLMKRRVSLTDVWDVSTSPILGLGWAVTYLSPNGAGSKDQGSSYYVP